MVTATGKKLDVLSWNENNVTQFLVRFGDEVYFPGLAADYMVETTFSKLKVTKKMPENQALMIECKFIARNRSFVTILLP